MLLSNWEDFGSNSNADAYDLNVRWMANQSGRRSWRCRMCSTGQVDLSGDGNGDAW